MSVELYSEDIVVVALAEEPSPYKIWLRDKGPDDLADDLRWLCDDSLDYHVIVDLTHLESFGSDSCKALLALREWTEEYDCRFVLCGLSSHLKRQLDRVRLSRMFDTFDTREAAIMELSAGRDLFP